MEDYNDGSISLNLTSHFHKGDKGGSKSKKISGDRVNVQLSHKFAMCVKRIY